MDTLTALWEQTQAADDLAPLPSGRYRCRLLGGLLGKSRHGTPGFKLTFEVVSEGEHAGRLIWHDLWLTPAALPFTKRDLLKIGITSIDQLEEPLLKVICDVIVALRCNDEGIEFNRVRSFTVVGSDEPNAFAPKEADV